MCDINSNSENENLLAESPSRSGFPTPQEHEGRTVDGTWYLARIQPYRTLENVIDGVGADFHRHQQARLRPRRRKN